MGVQLQVSNLNFFNWMVIIGHLHVNYVDFNRFVLQFLESYESKTQAMFSLNENSR